MNLFKQNAKKIAATIFAAVVTISMSFRAPEGIEVHVQEAAPSIKIPQTTEVKPKGMPAAVSAGAAVVAAAAAVINAVANAVNVSVNLSGSHHVVAEIKSENNLINTELIKVSQFD